MWYNWISMRIGSNKMCKFRNREHSITKSCFFFHQHFVSEYRLQLLSSESLSSTFHWVFLNMFQSWTHWYANDPTKLFYIEEMLSISRHQFDIIWRENESMWALYEYFITHERNIVWCIQSGPLVINLLLKRNYNGFPTICK